MDAFERFNIRYMSPTMLAQWDSAPVTLILRRLYGVRMEPNPNMWRGDAVEAGLALWLHNRGDANAAKAAEQRAIETFWDRAKGEVTEEAEAVEEQIPGMIEQGIQALSQFPARVMGTQFGIEHHLSDIATPVTGKIDFLFEDKQIVELKTTMRCPSKLESVSASHRWQAAIYAASRNTPVNLLYVTPKKHVIFEVAPDDDSLAVVANVAKSLETALATAKDADHLLRSLPLNVSSFYWDEDVLSAYDRALDGEIKPISGPGTESLPAQGFITFGKHAGKHIKDVPASYLDWVMNPSLSDGTTFDVPADLQDAIRNMREAA